ncbi:RAQPRD family integrative conjugative element protein [Pokkaliibacter sp. MBI-7]|uniref:integrative conjugative element protein, RAQPRD family n=2 Tax=Pokkaliibacter sp. MBI-7 TaxID=3040600 RepID=UPI002448D544|nr:RAQPRD family integrative conjugative element protein [Pokkaliibacter sp. MBI-7]MDH2436660.1 RAQPRD family integrative conjugative element protein [Pokkaliibacter sp. MBI-7]
MKLTFRLRLSRWPPQPGLCRSLLCGLGMGMALTSLSVSAASSAEQEELSLVLKQLDSIKMILDRSEVAQRSRAGDRYAFNYDQAKADLARMSRGISQYLSPSRAQPRDASQLSGAYQVDQRGKQE